MVTLWIEGPFVIIHNRQTKIKFISFSFQTQLLVFTLCVCIIHLAMGDGTSHCVNAQYTSLIDSEIRHLRMMDVTHHDYINATLSAFVESSMCNPIPVAHHTLFNYRSMCPWKYVSDIDHNRFPVRLNMAKCMCSNCAHNFECKPVLYTIPVLKKQCENGYYHWVQKMQLISVSCYCARPPMLHVDKRQRLFNVLKRTFENRTFNVPSELSNDKWRISQSWSISESLKNTDDIRSR